jgi:hypothetical protein
MLGRAVVHSTMLLHEPSARIGVPFANSSDLVAVGKAGLVFPRAEHGATSTPCERNVR